MGFSGFGFLGVILAFGEIFGLDFNFLSGFERRFRIFLELASRQSYFAAKARIKRTSKMEVLNIVLVEAKFDSTANLFRENFRNEV